MNNDMELGLVEGGQGHSDDSVRESANVVTLTLILAALGMLAACFLCGCASDLETLRGCL